MTQLLSLLLVDPDPDGLEILTFGFEREGASVNATSDMVAAPKLVGAAMPSLVIVTLRPADPSALEVIRRMRTGGHAIPHIAVLALGPAEQRDPALAAGASEFLATPTYIRDIVNAGKLAMVGRRASGQAEPQTEARLSDYRGLYYLLRAMAATGGSAVLRLERGSRRAELRISEGRLLSANVESLQSLPALHHALLWEEAALSIKLGAVGKRNQLNLSAQEVLDESERFLRDFGHAARDLGASTTVYAATSASSAAPGLQASQAAPLLRLADGNRNLADMIAESPFRIFDTLRMIKRLRDSGALAAREPRSDAHPPGRNGSAGSMLGEWAMVPDLRGVVGDRRGPSRQLRPVATAAPAPSARAVAPAPSVRAVAPVPVTRAAEAPHPVPAPVVVDAGLRQMTTQAGEILPRRRFTPEPLAPASLGEAPTIQVKLAADGTPLAPLVSPAASAATPLPPDATPPPVRLPGQPTPIPLRTRVDQALRARMDATPPPDIRRPPTGPHAPLDRPPPTGPHAPLDRPPPTGPHARLDRAAAGPPARLDRAPSGPPARLDRPPAGPQARLDRGAPGTQARLDRTPAPRAKPQSGPQARLDRTPAPRPRPASGPQARLDRTPAPRVKPPSGPQPTVANSFDDVEADFFAREADLYKREAVETFDDLDSPLGRTPGNKSRSRKK
jgi:DNA-binding response OmpR family regulator